MAKPFDVIVIGSGLGGLTAAAVLTRAGRSVLVIERNHTVGGAASTYKVGDLMVEASLHATSDPRHPGDPKHEVLARAGVLDAVEWIPVRPFYEVRGGPVGGPFVLPDGFDAARVAFGERFPSARHGIELVLGKMERISSGIATLSVEHGRSRQAGAAMLKLIPLIREWRRSLGDVLANAVGDNEAVKCALAANIAYYHDDPDTLWWLMFAVAQSGYLAPGGRYIKGGSGRLSHALAGVVMAGGGALLRSRTVTRVHLDADGRPSGVTHERHGGGDPIEATAPVIISNAAPSVVADLLSPPAGQRFAAAYAGLQLSISVFSATFGLSVRPSELGIRYYSTFLLPPWMTSLSDYRRCADLLADAPGTRMPALTVVDYAAIDSGMGGPPYPVSVVGVDRPTNWSGLDAAAADRKREQWRQALIDTIDRDFPGFARCVVSSVFNTALSMRNYLNTPGGAIYGFAPLPPSKPIWRGIDRSARTPIKHLYLASAFGGAGGFTGAIRTGGAAADCILAET